MRIIFFGTPEYVLPILASVHKKFSHRGVSPIAAVVTQKPKPTDRKQVLTYSPIDSWAHKRKVPVFYSSREILASGIKTDVGILAAYGEIIPESVINYFKSGILNVHPSILPKYRGASPVQAAIVAGEAKTGVTVIKLDKELDHGPVVSQFEEEIHPADTAGTLRERLFARSAPVVLTLIEPYLKGKIALRQQDHMVATFTKEVKKDDAFIPPQYLDSILKGDPLRNQKWQIPFMRDYSLVASAHLLERFIRAMQPWPAAWTTVKLGSNWKFSEKRLKILRAHIALDAGYLILDTVHLEGKNPVSWEEFKRGYPDAKFA